MRFSIALDGRRKQDQVIEEKGVPFVMDAFVAAIAKAGVVIRYNDDRDTFSLEVVGAPACSG
ncbi:MAG: hypothetical protein OWT27_03010 [Firmicutes bacterium]|nr:hypothetical protein [Bacillota bacterium]